MGNTFGGTAVALVVLLFANLVKLVVMPALAGLVIVAGIQMININNIQMVWQTNPVSRAFMLVTFGSTLFMPLQYAVLLGVAISILMIVFQQSNTIRVVEWVVGESDWPVERPAPKHLKSGKVTALYIYGNLFYAAALAYFGMFSFAAVIFIAFRFAGIFINKAAAVERFYSRV